jgi:hypothetical protein
MGNNISLGCAWYLYLAADLLLDVKMGDVTANILADRLREHIERIDTSLVGDGNFCAGRGSCGI